MSKHKLICCIVNHEKGSRTLKAARKYNIKGGTIFLGKGTVKNKLLELLDLNDTRKDIVLMGANSDVTDTAIEQLAKDLCLKKPGHGIAFALPLDRVFGSWNRTEHDSHQTMEDSYMYNAIVTIVEKGNAEDVITAANSAGARGGTIIHARGSGAHETEVLFAMPIEPEKDIVLIIAESDITEQITTAIRDAIDIEEPGKGIILVTGIDQVYGLY